MTKSCCETWNEFQRDLEWEDDENDSPLHSPTWNDVPVKFCPFCGADKTDYVWDVYRVS